MKRIAAMVVAIGAGLLVCVSVAQATEPFAKVGRYYGATWISLPRGVRSIGMGATGTADASGLGTGYFNPAVVAFADATVLTGSYEDLGAHISLSDLLVSAPFPFHSDSTAGPWHFAGSFGYSRLGMEPQTERTIFLPEGTGRTFDADDWMLSALGATSWTHGVATISAGATGKYMVSNLAADDVTIWALDAGALAAFPMHTGGGLVQPRLGYAFLNLDTGGDYDGRTYSVANEQRAGFGFDIMTPPVQVSERNSVPSARLSLDYDRVDREDHPSREYSAGFEISIVNCMSFRYGTIDGDDTTYGVGIGWDYGNVLFRADFAHDEDFGPDTYGALIGVRW